MSARPWTAAEKAKLRSEYPDTPTRDIKIRGKTPAEIKSQCANLHLRKSDAFMRGPDGRKRWTPAEIKKLRKLYPHESAERVAKAMGMTVASTYAKANQIGLHKTAAYLASPSACRLRRGDNVGAATRFQKGHVPANKGLRRPGWAPGRMAETQFKPGQRSKRWNPEDYPVGALRLNADGFVDMKVKEGPRAWQAFHRLIWEDARGPIPAGHVLRFKDRDRLNIDLDNLELLTLAQNARRNSIHNLPAPLKEAIMQLGRLKRRIRREEQDRRSA